MPSRISAKAIRSLVAMCILPATGCAMHATERSTRTRPNILYVMTDQQPSSCIGAYGNPIIQTPAIDELARSGCAFNQFYITAFACSPSRASMFSGRYAHNHGVVQNDILFDEKVPCLGDICQAAGYDTGYFGKWHLGGNMYRGVELSNRPGFGDNWHYRLVRAEDGFTYKPVSGGFGEDKPQHGFATWAGGWKNYHEYLHEVGLGDLLEKNKLLGNHQDLPSGKEGTHIHSLLPEEHHMDAFLAKRTERFIRDHAAGDRPWCAVLSFYGPHLPVAPPKPWDTMYSLDQVTLPANHLDTLEGKPAGQKNNKRCYVLPRWNDDQYKDYIRRYWGYCSYIDKQIGRVFNALRETSQWDNTIVVFTTDHGDMVGAHGMIYKLGSCGYEELYHIPTIVRIPGVTKPGSRIDALASNIDLLPTLLDASHIQQPDGIDGKSLLRLLQGKTTRHRDVIFASNFDNVFICCDGRYKYVINRRGDHVNELYDLQTDPGELKNLAYDPVHKNTADTMIQLILHWLRDTHHPYAELIARQSNAG